MLRVGPAALINLFSSPTNAVFTPLPNACLLQISGTPMSENQPHTTISALKRKHRAGPEEIGTDDGVQVRRRERTRGRKRSRKSREDGNITAVSDACAETEATSQVVDPTPLFSPAPHLPLNSRSLARPTIHLRNLTRTSSTVALDRPAKTPLRATTSMPSLMPKRPLPIDIFKGPSKPSKRRKQEVVYVFEHCSSLSCLAEEFLVQT